MATIPKRYTSSIPIGRPSQNLGHIANSLLSGGVNLPVNIFPSNPLTLNRPIAATHVAATKTAQVAPAASGRLISMLVGSIPKNAIKLRPLVPRQSRYSSKIGTAVWVGSNED